MFKEKENKKERSEKRKYLFQEENQEINEPKEKEAYVKKKKKKKNEEKHLNKVPWRPSNTGRDLKGARSGRAAARACRGSPCTPAISQPRHQPPVPGPPAVARPPKAKQNVIVGRKEDLILFCYLLLLLLFFFFFCSSSSSCSCSCSSFLLVACASSWPYVLLRPPSAAHSLPFLLDSRSHPMLCVGVSGRAI